QEDAGLLEQLARGGNVIRNRIVTPVRLKADAALDRALDAVAPGVVGVVIGGVDPAAGKHVRAAHERGAFVTADHEHFRAGRAVAEHDDGCGGARVGGDHGGQYYRMARESPGMDMNAKIAALLRDFAAIQKSKQRMWGYKRAAAAILDLEEPIESLLQADGTLRKIPNVGPSSTRVILEVLTTGTSATIERAIDESGERADVARRRDLRGH